jgi:hypothetical protein
MEQIPLLENRKALLSLTTSRLSSLSFATGFLSGCYTLIALEVIVYLTNKALNVSA